MACAPRTVVLAMRDVHRVRLVTGFCLSQHKIPRSDTSWTRAPRFELEGKITQTATITVIASNPSSLFRAAEFVPYITTDGSNELTLQLSHKGVEVLLYVYKTESTNKTRRRGEGTNTLLIVCPCHWLQTWPLTLLVPFSLVDRKHPSRRPWYDQLLFVFCPL